MKSRIMAGRYSVQVLVATILWFYYNSAWTAPIVKKFKNPAMQFVGTWEVKSHDFREFYGFPEDLERQLQERVSAFPVGMHIRFEWTGSAGMPGGIDLKTMQFSGPIGETLSMTILYPDLKKLCGGYWDFICDKNKAYSNNLMIVQIEKWSVQEREAIWPEIVPIEYSLVHLAKTYSFDAWIAKNGDMVLPIVLDGRSRDGDGFGIMGVYLEKTNK
ncbi:hypothetical protein INH39_09530 [Massilia violaceinigra]|uniref:Uncharacterized protein n=1 Tax=Massilia violaceinigra TaxID=2045208 RepID=A0ABY4AH15_9BURK|nr:hypothetical protein [Massilia violaceinigra]UOD31883.1 hypothetical protein INH39_09530 [Massilia violaceinigra]